MHSLRGGDLLYLKQCVSMLPLLKLHPRCTALLLLLLLMRYCNLQVLSDCVQKQASHHAQCCQAYSNTMCNRKRHVMLSAVKLTASPHAGVPVCRYEGTVECMTKEEWTAQAKSLWGDLIDEHGRLKICRDAERRLNTSSIEGAAQATLETVYGQNSLRYKARTHALLFIDCDAHKCKM